MKSVFVHVVTWNSKPATASCLEAILRQSGLDSMRVLVSDNDSSNGIAEDLAHRFAGRIEVVKNPSNIGFCAAHNRAAFLFLESGCEFLFVLNPDVRLEENALSLLCDALQKHREAGSACPRLFRADGDLNPVQPRRIDSAGMVLTKALRHFDRGSEEDDSPQYAEERLVFGASGAALLMKRGFVGDLLLDAGDRESDSFRVLPQLKSAPAPRALLFDEAFFAYREDADLAWRGQLLGWTCVYAPAAVGYHERVVLPERRDRLPAALNAMSVKNRFLLQLNNYFFCDAPGAFVPGVLFRNLLVLCGVAFREWSSLPALAQALKLVPRALARRKILRARRRLPAGHLQIE